MKQMDRGVSLRGLVILLVVLVVLGGWLAPRYFGQLEKTNALAMQAMLVETAIAQEQVFAKQKKYTTDWAALLPKMTFSPTLQAETKALPESNTCFFGFGKNAAKKENGFLVTVRLAAEGQSGTVVAQRVHSLFYKYQLSRNFPDGEATTCTATQGKEFCKRISQDINVLELKNLVLAPVDKTAGK